MTDLVLLTDAATPIYHNPCPTDEDSIAFKQRWKGYCLFEFYETGHLSLFEDGGAEPKKELSRYVVVWDQNTPRSIMDGMWCEMEGWGENAVLAPGTTEEVREMFHAWVQENPDNHFGTNSLNIDRQVVIAPVQGTIDNAKEEIDSLFDSFLIPQTSDAKEA